MRHLFFAVFFLSWFNAFAQTDSLPYIPPYDTVMYQGPDIDRLCNIERERAATDASTGRYYFIDDAIYRPRYTKFIAPLCRPYHITYCWMPEAVLGFEGFNPLRCYMAAMDSAVQKKYGAFFKTMLIARADSFFIARLNTDTIDEQYCSPAPRLANDSIYKGPRGEVFYVTIDSALYKQYTMLSHCFATPFMDITIMVQPDGTVSNYSLLRFAGQGRVFYTDTMQHSVTYNGCGNAFWQLALNRLKQYPRWQPGYVSTTPVKAWHRVEVFFKL